MRTLLGSLFLSVLVLVPASAQAAAEPSLAPVWDTSKVVAAFASQAGRLKPILDQLKPQEWAAAGAPQIYITQWEDVRKELDYVTQSAKSFENDPERLTLALDTYFRWQRLAGDLGSLVEGVRHYQNPAVGDLIVAVMGENSSNRDLLQQHITDLAAQKEQEFTVVDQEAQRCRGVVTHTPAPAPQRPAAAKPKPPTPRQ